MTEAPVTARRRFSDENTAGTTEVGTTTEVGAQLPGASPGVRRLSPGALPPVDSRCGDCQGEINVLLGSGAFTISSSMPAAVDGFTPLTYAHNARCVWAVQAGGPVTLSFVSFATEASYDVLELYEGSSPGTLAPAHTFSGLSMPPAVTMATGMRIVFRSDSTVSGAGFVAQLSTTIPYMQNAVAGSGMVTVNARVEDKRDEVGVATTLSTIAAPGSSGGDGGMGVGSAAAIAAAVAVVLVLIGWATWRLRNGKKHAPPARKGRVSLPGQAGVYSASVPNLSNAGAEEPTSSFAASQGTVWFVRSEMADIDTSWFAQSAMAALPQSATCSCPAQFEQPDLPSPGAEEPCSSFAADRGTVWFVRSEMAAMPESATRLPYPSSPEVPPAQVGHPDLSSSDVQLTVQEPVKSPSVDAGGASSAAASFTWT